MNVVLSEDIHYRLVDAGCLVGVVANDIYVLETPEAEAILASMPKRAGIWRFTSSDTGKRWIGIPDAAVRWKAPPMREAI